MLISCRINERVIQLAWCHFARMNSCDLCCQSGSYSQFASRPSRSFKLQIPVFLLLPLQFYVFAYMADSEDVDVTLTDEDRKLHETQTAEAKGSLCGSSCFLNHRLNRRQESLPTDCYGRKSCSQLGSIAG